MTLKSLYSEKLGLYLDKLSRNAYITTLYGLYFFFAMTVNAAVSIENMNLDYLLDPIARQQRIIEVVNSALNVNNMFVAAAILFAAVISAMSSFYYLNSKTQIDFYHSLPIKREKLFLINYISGILFFIIPYLINFVLTVIVIFITGKGLYFNLETAAYSLLVSILLYAVIYSISLSAAMLCGNTIVALLGAAVFLGYFPAFYGLYYSYMEAFFKTFFGQAISSGYCGPATTNRPVCHLRAGWISS
jgi:ABC-2 type transport system permease protein